MIVIEYSVCVLKSPEVVRTVRYVRPAASGIRFEVVFIGNATVVGA